MYRVLIVDDEPRQRRFIANAIGKLRPGYEVLEAKNGKDAAEIIRESFIHIMITDIKMPIMDGLTLIEEFADPVKQIKVVVLSGYAYFEYAQKALKLGVLDFVLKPVNEEKLDELLKKAEDKLRQEDREIQEKNNLVKRLNTSFPAYIEHQLNKWIRGNLTKQELDEISDLFPYKRFGVVTALEISKNEYAAKSYQPEEINEINQNMKFWIKEAMTPVGHSISFYLEDREYVMITIVNSEEDICDLLPANLYRLEELLATLKNSYELECTIGVGRVSGNLFEEIVRGCDEALTALGCKFFRGGGKIISLPEDRTANQRRSYSVYEQENELSHAIESLDKEKIACILQSLFDRAGHADFCNPGGFKEAILHLSAKMINDYRDIIPEPPFHDLLNELKTSVEKSETCFVLKQKVTDALMNLADIVKNIKNSGNDVLVKKCKQYIEEHYMEDISREALAGMFGLSNSYFSCFFKNETGVTFSEFLLETRMKKAQELLGGSRMKIAEVARKTGYRDIKYFDRVFKKQFGVSPEEYRRIKLLNRRIGHEAE